MYEIAHSTVLTLTEEAMVMEFRRRTLLRLDDVLGCLRDNIPKLTRSSLHRCLERHGISRLLENPDKASKRGKFAETPIGYVHIDISELRLTQGKLNMFLAIDRVSKFTYAEFRDDAGGASFLRGVVEAFPYAIPTVLTDNGMAFADLPKNRNGPTRRYLGPHIFDRVWKTPFEVIYHAWTKDQDIFKLNPRRLIPGPNIYSYCVTNFFDRKFVGSMGNMAVCGRLLGRW